MARRILFVKTTSLFRDPDKELFVDAGVDVDWKVRMAVDNGTGEVAIAPPTLKVRSFERYPSEFNEYGLITNPDEIAWLENAMAKPPHDLSYKAINLVARVNQLGITNSDGQRGFSIEVMTGVDADKFVSFEKGAAALAFAKKYWWQLGLALLALWWWFFARHS